MTLETEMRAVSTTTGGGIESLAFHRLPLPKPKADDLLVKVQAAALNHADLYQRDGTWPAPPGAPATLGVEIAGTVVQGDAAGRFGAGAAVMGLVVGGGYAEYALLDAGMAAPVPRGLSFVQAAALPEALTVGHNNLVVIGTVRHDQTILIHGGASGMGSMAIQMASQLGARVATTVGHPGKVSAVRALGASIVLDRHDPELCDAAMRWTDGRGYDLIIDIAGAETLTQNLRLLADRGCLILMGVMSGAISSIDIDVMLMKRLTLRGTILRSIPLEERRSLASATYAYWLPFIETGAIAPVIAGRHPFAAVRAGHAQLQANQHVGKIILDLGGAEALPHSRGCTSRVLA